MNEQEFQTVALTHKDAIYSGKWRFTPYSVTVRYKQREVSISAGGRGQKDMAKALLTELIDHDSQSQAVLRAPAKPALQAASNGTSYVIAASPGTTLAIL
jgi:hypothetical protein